MSATVEASFLTLHGEENTYWNAQGGQSNRIFVNVSVVPPPGAAKADIGTYIALADQREPLPQYIVNRKGKQEPLWRLDGPLMPASAGEGGRAGQGVACGEVQTTLPVRDPVDLVRRLHVTAVSSRVKNALSGTTTGKYVVLVTATFHDEDGKCLARVSSRSPHPFTVKSKKAVTLAGRAQVEKRPRGGKAAQDAVEAAAPPAKRKRRTATAKRACKTALRTKGPRPGHESELGPAFRPAASVKEEGDGKVDVKREPAYVAELCRHTAADDDDEEEEEEEEEEEGRAVVVKGEFQQVSAGEWWGACYALNAPGPLGVLPLLERTASVQTFGALTPTSTNWAPHVAKEEGAEEEEERDVKGERAGSGKEVAELRLDGDGLDGAFEMRGVDSVVKEEWDAPFEFLHSLSQGAASPGTPDAFWHLGYSQDALLLAQDGHPTPVGLLLRASSQASLVSPFPDRGSSCATARPGTQGSDDAVPDLDSFEVPDGWVEGRGPVAGTCVVKDELAGRGIAAGSQ